ncbi:DUF2079 domain-containing protein [Streptomyces sp. RB6PN25]|uniref:DUF2079 domain-containing protein n=1 Tax=Streptomyces humicola TaxID=2953240 RepID=A0ABT1PQY4_9ACTN|nr:DUF2079 domain-containing protein [Streptomyces humicola]MCQ4079360.1 DUF2079 domain-containing protein [Streptomyces humicola]
MPATSPADHRYVTLPAQRGPHRWRPSFPAVSAGREVPRAACPRWVWGMAGLLFAAYAAVSVRLHERLLSSGYDLGIFEQAVRSYAHLHLPVSELKGPGFQLLGDHFSPILATLAPFYRLWPSPLTLLLAQAGLLAAAVVPLARWTERAVGRGAAVVVAVAYGASWGVAQTVGFDFHEVCFAVPLLAFSLTALGEGRLRAAVAWAVPLLLVKEDLGLTLAVIGALVTWKGALRLGLLAACVGLLGTVVEVLVVIPAFNAAGSFTYWDKLPGTGSGSGATPGTGQGSGLVHLLYQVTIGMITPDVKAMTLLTLLAPTAFLALRSPLMCVAVPTLAWRFVSDNSMYWGTDFHYSAVLMPIVFAAFTDALTRWPAAGMRHVLAVSGGVTALLFPQAPLYQLVQRSTWSTPPRVAVAYRILDKIPAAVTVAATDHLVPQLTHRDTVTVFGFSGSRPNPEYIVADMRVLDWPLTPSQKWQQIDAARSHGYHTIADQDGIILLHRG